VTSVILSDIEANGLDPDKFHCGANKVWGQRGQPFLITDLDTYVNSIKGYDKIVFHNGLGYDLDAINKLYGSTVIHPEQIIDTAVVSRTVQYQRFMTHSLKEYGQALGVYKGDYTGGWEVYTAEMGEYCVQDVVVLEAIFKDLLKYISDPDWSKALKVEHQMASICKGMQDTGFPFDIPKAEGLLEDVKRDMQEIEDSFSKSFPPKLTEVNRIQYRTKKDGTLYANVERAMSSYPKTTIEGNELVCYDYVPFNPGSSKQRIDVLWDSGWEPVTKTKGHLKHLRENR